MRYVFADCRWSLDDPEWGRREYLAGHIPGAVFVDVERELSGPPGSGGRHPLPAADDFARAAGRAGIGDGVFVVAYGTLGGAERLWWLLRHFGHDACGVIELAAWRGPVASGDERVAPASFEPRERADDTIGRRELAERLNELVVPGRIPAALNAPWNEELPELPDGELVAYCGSGITACVTLHRLALRGRPGRLYPGSWSEWEQHDELPRERE
jgi:thiosulfate/3-mercaptopyruvate sulfurtransferase